MSDNNKTIKQYNELNMATRAALSSSWMLGNVAGLLTSMFNKKSEGVEAKNIPMINSVLPVAHGSTVLAKWVGVAAIAPVESVLAGASALSIVADAFGIGTGKSFGAMRAGFATGRGTTFKGDKQPKITPKARL